MIRMEIKCEQRLELATFCLLSTPKLSQVYDTESMLILGVGSQQDQNHT